jgi:hypothetical protein
MVPSIAGNGASFRGTGLYYLHDKAEKGREKPSTANRVAWTSTRNLANEDPEKAIDEMWHTAEDAARLKAGRGGRRCDDPVKTLSLAWAPHQSPTREQMEVAVDGYLKAMGWQEHQALLICHNDEPHPHVHLILNRVHPETGRILNDWKDWKRSQRWALDYEKEEGQVLCLARVDKYDRGLDLRPDGMPYPYAKLSEEQQRAFESEISAHAVQDLTEKDLLAERHKQHRKAFLASGRSEFRHMRQVAYREVRDAFKPRWRQHFENAKDVHEELRSDTAAAHREVIQLAREGDHQGAHQVLSAFDERRDGLLRRLADQRRELRDEQLEKTRDAQNVACLALIGLRRDDFNELKLLQKEERTEFKVLVALRDAGQVYDADRLRQLLGHDAPELDLNRIRELPEAANENPAPTLGTSETNPFMQAVRELVRDALHVAHERGPQKDATDLAAGAIGAAVEVGLRLMEGFISPPTPRERALERARAIREEEIAPEIAAACEEDRMRQEFIRHAATAAREAETEREEERKLYWEERGRSRSRER